MEALGEKSSGLLLFQFGKFDKYAFKSLDDFLARLILFWKGSEGTQVCRGDSQQDCWFLIRRRVAGAQRRSHVD